MEDSQKIKENGMLISEYIPNEGPRAYHFPRRNRIIAGMSKCTIVVESKKTGGAMITARLANDYNRDVFAVPGNNNQVYSSGSNLLIQRHQATILNHPEQIVEYLDLKKSLNKTSIKNLSNYFDEIFSLSEILFKSIIKLYKNDESISSHAFSRIKTLSTLRFNYYPNQIKPVEVSKQDGIALGCETHVDSGVFTILYQDKKGGLQVQNRKNKKWYNVPFNKNALIVNTGLALEYLSKGKFKATNHRVLWNKSKRMSIPFFFEPSYDFRMSHSFLNGTSKNEEKGMHFQDFLRNSLKKFIEYQR